MIYNFDEIIDRRHSNSSKWNVKEHEIAMTVADMDFKTAPCITQAILKKASLGIYGYSEVPDAYFQSYVEWWQKRHHFTLSKDWLIYSSGVVAAISSIIRKLTTPAEKVLLQAPVYNIFYNCIVNNGREVISSDLIYENYEYHIDFNDLEQKLKDPQTTIMILCNPHNPIGKIWNKEELSRIGYLCAKYHVLVISDEVHCDITEPGCSYLPFASVNEQCRQNSITCLSTSKTFNMAGLQSACIVVPEEAVRHKVWRGLNTDEVGEPNVFACEAAIAAFHEGEVWLEEVRNYISENKKIAVQFMQTHLPQLHVVMSQATYLLWIDVSVMHPFVDQFQTFLQEEKHLYVSNGKSYGKQSEDFLRMNIACPKDVMMEGLNRLKEGADEFMKRYVDQN